VEFVDFAYEQGNARIVQNGGKEVPKSLGSYQQFIESLRKARPEVTQDLFSKWKASIGG